MHVPFPLLEVVRRHRRGYVCVVGLMLFCHVVLAFIVIVISKPYHSDGVTAFHLAILYHISVAHLSLAPRRFSEFFDDAKYSTVALPKGSRRGDFVSAGFK